MRFEWDDNKNLSNCRKHGVIFEVAAQVFQDPNFLMMEDQEVDGEERWKTIGLSRSALLLIVVHTYRDEFGVETVRIISAREVTAPERRRYEANAN